MIAVPSARGVQACLYAWVASTRFAGEMFVNTNLAMSANFMCALPFKEYSQDRWQSMLEKKKQQAFLPHHFILGGCMFMEKQSEAKKAACMAYLETVRA